MDALAADPKFSNPFFVGMVCTDARGSGTPFLIPVVFAVKAMRLYTDGMCALLAQTMDIEIGGAFDRRHST